MYAMQYEITLPADYDMGVIRRRVASRGSALDSFPGLGLKAYLMRERGELGSEVNQYAPFYLWADTAAMGRFLWGGAGFGALVASFGRPVVRHWTGVGCMSGSATGAVPKGATRQVTSLPPDVDPVDTAARAMLALECRSRQPGVHSTAAAIDPFGWELIEFTLWAEAGPDGAGERYEVLHLSTPELGRIVSGPPPVR